MPERLRIVLVEDVPEPCAMYMVLLSMCGYDIDTRRVPRPIVSSPPWGHAGRLWRGGVDGPGAAVRIPRTPAGVRWLISQRGSGGRCRLASVAIRCRPQQVQHLCDNAVLTVGVMRDDGEGLVRGCGLCLRGLSPAQDRGKRRQQFVREDGQDFLLIRAGVQECLQVAVGLGCVLAFA